MLPSERRAQTLARIAADLGLDETLLERCAGRVPPSLFCRELLREQRLVCGMYDATLTAVDPSPDRATHEGPDPTLFALERAFTAAINGEVDAATAVAEMKASLDAL